MAQLAQNYEDFTGKVIDGIMNGLNNTEYGKEFTKKLAVQQLRENPDMTVETLLQKFRKSIQATMQND